MFLSKTSPNYSTQNIFLRLDFPLNRMRYSTPCSPHHKDLLYMKLQRISHPFSYSIQFCGERYVPKVAVRQARSYRGAMGTIAPPNSESITTNFQVNQAFDMKAKEMCQCNSRKLLKKPIPLHLFSRTWSKQYGLPVAHD